MIKIGKVDKKLLIPIFNGILFLPFTIVARHTEVKSHYLIFSLCSSIGMSFSIIPLLISRIKMRKAMTNKNNKNYKNIKENKKNKIDIEIQLIYNKGSEEIKRYKFLYIFLSSLTDFLQTIIATITYNYKIKVNFWLLDILFLSLLSYIILNIKLLKHQILSITIIIVLGILLDFLFGSLLELQNNIGYFCLRFFCEFCFSFSQIINKYCMEYKFSRPYEVCLFIGIYTFCFYLFSLILSSNIPCKHNFCFLKDEKKNLKYFDNFKIYYDKINFKEIILILIEIIILGLINILTILTIKYFTPFHCVIIFVIGRILLTFEKFFEGTKLYDIIYIIILILILFSVLVYIEIIVLNFCGIQKYTKDNIEKRGELDIVLTLNNINERNDTLVNINDNKKNNDDLIINNDNNDSDLESFSSSFSSINN